MYLCRQMVAALYSRQGGSCCFSCTEVHIRAGAYEICPSTL